MHNIGASSRRGFLGQLGGPVAGGLTLAASKVAFAQSMEQLTQLTKAGDADEGYWAKIRDRFLLDTDFGYLNNGTVGPTPRPVYDSMVQYWRMMAENPNENSAILQDRVDAIREKSAAFFGVTPSEVAILRNATEGNNLVCQGIDLKAGDEVLIGYLEHDSNRQPWQVKAKRHGIVVKEVPVGTPAKSPEEIRNAFEAAITPRTRVISVAHCDTVTGTFHPIREIAALAHSRNIICCADGAQTLGMVQFNVKDLGVDTYATTCHKWLCSPAGAGLLYVRKEMQERIWPNIVTENWWTFTDARKYEHISRRPWPVVAALEDALDFQLAIGRARIEQRVRSLATYFRSHAAEIPGVHLYTSNDPRLAGGLTSLSIDNVAPEKLREYLRQRYDLYTAARNKGIRYPADPHGVEGIRISTHYYNTFEQVDRALRGLRDLAEGKA